MAWFNQYLDSRAEILQIFALAFLKNWGTKKSFWNYLTFSHSPMHSSKREKHTIHTLKETHYSQKKYKKNHRAHIAFFPSMYHLENVRVKRIISTKKRITSQQNHLVVANSLIKQRGQIFLHKYAMEFQFLFQDYFFLFVIFYWRLKICTIQLNEY